MRYLKIIFVLFFVFGCQKQNKTHIAIGTWNKCLKDGSYFEYKITDEYIMVLTTKSEEIILFRNKVTDKGLIMSEFKNGASLIINNDTLITVSESENKVILKSTYTYDTYEFNKAEFKIDKIDSLNLESWKNKTVSEFKKRAELASCLDLRTEEEKIIPTLNMDDLEEEEIQIIETEKK
ncbi:hypothetical protein [Bizionia algoritergicola]|uniref:Uncharacterized protein n=1 Tax=Bizionia algoritergicola TaxID=291187 RepID=A0A5D0QN84_9FLAO|nr:hypothetical protein [Bizionia algoritergicola]TYB70627.1 hypothetical protein ES675_15760 [Bizionia algoritergicola]